MSERQRQVGISQRVRLEWLERTARLALAGCERDAIAASLDEYLKDKVSRGRNARSGNRKKIAGMLMKVWAPAPDRLRGLREAGLELLRSVPAESRIALHWGMTMAAYPFWAAVAASAGRLLRLQGAAAVAQVQRRVQERYGQRTTVAKAVQRVLRSFVDWKVLVDTEEPGIYGAGKRARVSSPELAGWLVEACLVSRGNDSGSLRAILDSPSFFPVEIDPAAVQRIAGPRLEVVRQSVSEELVVRR